jgi:hypothetical protein
VDFFSFVGPILTYFEWNGTRWDKWIKVFFSCYLEIYIKSHKTVQYSSDLHSQLHRQTIFDTPQCDFRDFSCIIKARDQLTTIAIWRMVVHFRHRNLRQEPYQTNLYGLATLFWLCLPCTRMAILGWSRGVTRTTQPVHWLALNCPTTILIWYDDTAIHWLYFLKHVKQWMSYHWRQATTNVPLALLSSNCDLVVINGLNGHMIEW